jgi:hypothetical protein
MLENLIKALEIYIGYYHIPHVLTITWLVCQEGKRYLDKQPFFKKTTISEALRRIEFWEFSDRIIRMIYPIPKTKTVLLCFDTTLLIRWSLNIPFVRKAYDVSGRRKCLGIILMFCFGIFKGRKIVKIPLGFRVCVGKKRTEILCEFLSDMAPYFRQRKIRVLLDGSLVSRETVLRCLSLGFHVTGVIRRNMKVEVGKVRDLQVAGWKQVAAWGIRVFVVPTLREVRKLGGEKVWEVQYLFSTGTSNPTRVVREYGLRWSQEVFHRVIKKELGLSEVQFRSPILIRNWVSIVCIAYVLLLRYEGRWRDRRARLSEQICSYMEACKDEKMRSFGM